MLLLKKVIPFMMCTRLFRKVEGLVTKGMTQLWDCPVSEVSFKVLIYLTSVPVLLKHTLSNCSLTLII